MSDGYSSPRVNAACISAEVTLSGSQGSFSTCIGPDHTSLGHDFLLSVFREETHFLMEALDGRQIKVLLPPPPQLHGVLDALVEIIGNAVDASTIKFLACINMGLKLDLQPNLAVVNQVVELTFDQKYKGRLF